ncbi:MAG: transposase [Acidimicrobiales bacterium]
MTHGSARRARFFWGLRLHLITTPSGLPVAYALAGAKTDERDTALDMIAFGELDTRGRVLIADKGYRRATFETELNQAGVTLIRPNLKSETPRPGARYLKAFRQIIESVNQTLKSQLDLERHGGGTRPGVCARILQRILALTAAIWHNETTQRDGPARSLTAYDH